MSRQVQLRRGTTAQNATFTGVQGELVVDVDLSKLILHDGTTVGGHKIATEAYAASQPGPQGIQGNIGPQGNPGTNGINGLDAYQEALSLGFVGTLQEWLTSLIGAQGNVGPAGSSATTGNVTITGNTIVTTNANEDLNIVPNGTGYVRIANRLRVNGITVGHGHGLVQSSTVVGEEALGVNTTGIENSAFGNAAMYSNTIGTDNSAFGHDTLFYNVDGSFNVAVGAHALLNNTSGNTNIGIGAYVSTLAPTDSNSIVIGSYATGIGSNTTVIGVPSTVTTRLYGTLQVGSTSVISSTGAWLGAHIIVPAPLASIGQAGDVVGMLAVDATYLYYCTAAYDGVTSIWKRQALTGATW